MTVAFFDLMEIAMQAACRSNQSTHKETRLKIKLELNHGRGGGCGLTRLSSDAYAAFILLVDARLLI